MVEFWYRKVLRHYDELWLPIFINTSLSYRILTVRLVLSKKAIISLNFMLFMIETIYWASH
ncbi:hypothetical protein T08_11125 [Trichinella sp. T8]|nr:hypothetical protein T08_11125 [Trichinella sp. T8]